MIQLKDIIQYYIGCQMVYASHHEPQNETYKLTYQNLSEAIEFGDQPILRRLEDMTKDEREAYHKLMFLRTDGVHIVQILTETPESYLWLLKNHFDIFHLIDNDLAIDAKTLNENNP